MKRYLIEFVSLLCLAVFVFFVLRDGGSTGIKPSEIDLSLSESGLLSPFVKANSLQLKRNIGLDYEALDDFVYYSSQDYMDVREILIIKTDQEALLLQAESAFRQRIQERQHIFESYGPEQYDMLCKAEHYQKDDYYILVIAENASQIMEEIRKLVESRNGI